MGDSKNIQLQHKKCKQYYDDRIWFQGLTLLIVIILSQWFWNHLSRFKNHGLRI